MPSVDMKCTQCGAEIQPDGIIENGLCEDCGNKVEIRTRQIHVIREKSLASAMVPFEISIGDKIQFSITNGTDKTLAIDEGIYQMNVKSKRSGFSETLNINKDITVYIKMKMNFKLDVRIE
jgi:predicted RNA-binding Zn-ribbon protein involved in translation (DUF1610 family)